MRDQWLVRRRHLPHVDVESKAFFVTACIRGSISATGLEAIRDFEQQLDRRIKPDALTEHEWSIRKHKWMFAFIDELLDGQSPARHLADPRLAEIVQNALLHFAGERYQLLAFVVMPSHHHWLFLPLETWIAQHLREQRDKNARRTPRESISHSIQSYTANQCNRVLGRSGPFWEDETYDHYARDEDELLRIASYIENNRVKAGLCASPEEFRWSSARLRTQLGLAMGESIQVV